MKGFFKTLLASVIGAVIALVLLLIIGITTLSVIVSKQEKPGEIKPNSIYELALNKPIVDRVEKDPFANIDPFNMDQQKNIGLNDILENIKKASENENIKGIFLHSNYVLASYGTMSEIRNALKKFKESGKFIIAYGDFYTQPAYFISSVADKVYLNPQGVIELKGLKAQLMYYKNALAKIGVEAQVVKQGKYKTATEVFTRTGMSVENRRQINAFIGSVWNYVSNEIAYSRHLTQQEIFAYANNIQENSLAEDALKYKLADELKYIDQVYDEIKTLSGSEKISLIKHNELKRIPAKRKGKGLAKDKIAVVYAYGNVVMGNEGEGAISSERISKAIRKARKDSSIKAIVLRVNSGGGSALASEVIWRELLLAKQVKPVIASMGDIAASGGYYITCPANVVMANEATLTGSIGVWGMIPNAKELMNKKLGINIDVAKTNPYADYPTIFKSLTETEKQALERSLDNVYETFLGHVSEGRDMSYADVHRIAQGRIWSGVDALDVKLIDKYGGISDAIEEAAQLAGLEYYRTVDLPKLEEPFEALIKRFSEEVSVAWSLKSLKGNKKLIEKEISKYSGIQARLPFEIEIE